VCVCVFIHNIVQLKNSIYSKILASGKLLFYILFSWYLLK